MLRVLHTIPSQILAKLKRNHPREIHLHFHGLQKIISFNFFIALPLLFSCLALIIFVSFFFSVIMSGRGSGVHDPISHNCAVSMLYTYIILPHNLNSTKLHLQRVAPRSQYSDHALEAVTLQ